jgi:hypothetical protein
LIVAISFIPPGKGDQFRLFSCARAIGFRILRSFVRLFPSRLRQASKADPFGYFKRIGIGEHGAAFV